MRTVARKARERCGSSKKFIASPVQLSFDDALEFQAALDTAAAKLFEANERAARAIAQARIILRDAIAKTERCEVAA